VVLNTKRKKSSQFHHQIVEMAKKAPYLCIHLQSVSTGQVRPLERIAPRRDALLEASHEQPAWMKFMIFPRQVHDVFTSSRVQY